VSNATTAAKNALHDARLVLDAEIKAAKIERGQAHHDANRARREQLDSAGARYRDAITTARNKYDAEREKCSAAFVAELRPAGAEIRITKETP